VCKNSRFLFKINPHSNLKAGPRFFLDQFSLNMQAGDSSIEMQAMGGESRDSADLAALSPSASSAAAAPGASTSVAGLSLMEQVKRERAEAEHVARIRARQAAARQRRANRKPHTGVWSPNGPKADRMGGGTPSFSAYSRPLAHMRQAWSDEERYPGYLGSIVYARNCAMVTPVVGTGDIVSTTLRTCRLPESASCWVGRVTMAAFLPLTLPIGVVASMTAGPVVGICVARVNREADLKQFQFNDGKRAGHIKVTHPMYKRGKRNKDDVTNTITGTDVSQGPGIASGMSAGEESFAM
jgi:hypothetical protein